MQFMSNDKIPKEEQVKEDIRRQQSETNLLFGRYVVDCELVKQTLIEVEQQIELELVQIEKKIISEFQQIYSNVQNSFLKLRELRQAD
mmetsp:Transcript_8816/g.14948  ORF Transcript_8816/g.14948 Transcript_8816/m.14948 type:complete len:88 (-) Transcript_8816:1095-1358(-)